MTNTSSKIEILSLDLFKSLKSEMAIVESLRGQLDTGIGWHYYLDLAWIIRQVERLPRGSVILDAGAGTGLTQFLLAELGFNVISVDFATRQFPPAISTRYSEIMHVVNDQSIVFDNEYTRHLASTYNAKHGEPANIAHTFGSPEDLASFVQRTRLRGDQRADHGLFHRDVVHQCGRIYLYKADLRDMKLIRSGLVDGVVSVSSLEHNDHAGVDACMRELRRVAKPGGLFAITVGGSLGDDWFHEQSRGWCYSEGSLKKLFGLPIDVVSNYGEKDRLFDELRKEQNELHKRLAPFYFQSGNNGMPWGKWEPAYLPVGVTLIHDPAAHDHEIVIGRRARVHVAGGGVVPGEPANDGTKIAVIIPFWEGDFELAKKQWAWLQRLRCVDEHYVHVFKGSDRELGRNTFSRVVCADIPRRFPEHAELAHPAGPNLLFVFVLRWLAQNGYTHFFWLETDCLPLKPDWLRPYTDVLSQNPADAVIGVGGGGIDGGWKHHFAGCSLYDVDSLLKLDLDRLIGVDIDKSFDVWLSIQLGYIHLADEVPDDDADSVIYGSRRYRWKVLRRPSTIVRGVYDHWRPHKYLTSDEIHRKIFSGDYSVFHSMKDPAIYDELMSSRLPLVSVLINNYNNGRFLQECIDSAITQTYPFREIIVVDDGSTDDSVEIIQSYGNLITSIVLEHGKLTPNFNQARAFRAGFEASHGDLVCPLDADDLWDNDKLAAIVSAFDDTAVVMVQHGAEQIDEDGNSLGDFQVDSVPDGDYLTAYLDSKKTNFFQATSFLSFRRDYINRMIHNLEPDNFTNTWFDVRLSRPAPFFGSVKTLPGRLGFYRRHSRAHMHNHDNLTDRILEHHDWCNKAFAEYGVNIRYTDSEQHRELTTWSETMARRSAAQRDLSVFRDIHTGGRCFVFGNGPSLNQMELDRFTGEFTFCSNAIFLLFSKISWRPTYYACVDSRVLPDRAAEIMNMRRENPPMKLFVPQRIPDHQQKDVSYDVTDIITPDAQTWYFNQVKAGWNNLPFSAFSPRPWEFVYEPMTVTITILQLAMMMGFESIYLVGCDTNYVVPESVKKEAGAYATLGNIFYTSTANDDPNHFDPSYFGSGRKWHYPQVDNMIRHYEVARIAAQKLGVKIFNATLGGKLEVFPRVDYRLIVK
jgi:glycosyltransferase involved in cell wall biosynthesis/SAM-dependent methyltransferase